MPPKPNGPQCRIIGATLVRKAKRRCSCAPSTCRVYPPRTTFLLRCPDGAEAHFPSSSFGTAASSSSAHTTASQSCWSSINGPNFCWFLVLAPLEGVNCHSQPFAAECSNKELCST